MNTPRTKPPRRYGSEPVKTRKKPDGQYRQGLHDEAIITLIGRIVTTLPVVEREMIGVLEELLGGSAPAQTVFYSIINNQTRITVMRALLESSSINADKDKWYDWVLDEYKAVSGTRNDYVHGLWWTHQTGRLFLEVEPLSPLGMLTWREVPGREINDAYLRLVNLHNALREHQIDRLRALVAYHSSQQTPPPPLDAEGSEASDHQPTGEELPRPPQAFDLSPQSDE